MRLCVHTDGAAPGGAWHRFTYTLPSPDRFYNFDDPYVDARSLGKALRLSTPLCPFCALFALRDPSVV